MNFDGLELTLRRFTSRSRLGDRSTQSFNLGRASLNAGLGCIDLPRQTDQTLASVCFSAFCIRHSLVFRSGAVLSVRPSYLGLGQLLT